MKTPRKQRRNKVSKPLLWVFAVIAIGVYAFQFFQPRLHLDLGLQNRSELNDGQQKSTAATKNSANKSEKSNHTIPLRGGDRQTASTEKFRQQKLEIRQVGSPLHSNESISAGNRKTKNESQNGVDFLRAIENCNDLVCVQKAHQKFPRATGMFNFPHFMIIGFQKAATTSLKIYLEQHPDIIRPTKKEPNFLTWNCKEKPPDRCPAKDTKQYLRKILRLDEYLKLNGTAAAFEASTHIVRAGPRLAPRLAELMPWLKIIINIREPISRAASMLVHNKDVGHGGCLARAKIGYCLRHRSQISEIIANENHPVTYTEAVQAWLDAFPTDQIHVVQYEELTSEEGEKIELERAKKFVGVDPSKLKTDLVLRNARRFTINPEGWKMKKEEYEELVDLVRPDVDSLINLLQKYNLTENPSEWRDRWESVWKRNLESCNNAQNQCNIVLS